MDFSEYQFHARHTAMYPNMGNNIYYPSMGLASEAGEVLGKVKKIHRDDNNVVTLEKKKALIKELGDVLWYAAALATELGVDLNEVATGNIEKLHSRKVRDKLRGSGDNR